MSFFRKAPKKEDPDSLTNQGMEHLANGDADAAITAFAAAVRLDPQHGQAWYGKGCAHSELEQFEQAIEAYQQSVNFAGERAHLPLYNLGNVYQRLNQLTDAARCFQQAVKLQPEMADAWINLGRVLDDSGQRAEAVKCYDVALELAPDDVVAWSNRGNSLRGLNQFEDALNSYRKALELDDQDFAARVGIGCCLVECGQADEGIAALQNALEETQHPMVMFELATALAKLDRHEAAVSLYDSLIEVQFTSAETWNNRGECLARLERIDDALQSFDQAIAFDPEFAPAYFGKARVLVNAERIDEARPLAQRYRELADDQEILNPPARALLSICGLDDFSRE